jgi:hypothetical protein
VESLTESPGTGGYEPVQLVIAQAQVPLVSTQTGPAVVPSPHMIVATFGPGVGHFSGGQGFGLGATQAQTDGELSNTVVVVQATVWMQVQTPAQSAPPAFGSQLS